MPSCPTCSARLEALKSCGRGTKGIAPTETTKRIARHAIYEEARKALHERLSNDLQISDAELVNEHYALEAAIYRVEDELLLSDMRRFVTQRTALSSPRLSFVSRVKEFVRSRAMRRAGSL